MVTVLLGGLPWRSKCNALLSKTIDGHTFNGKLSEMHVSTEPPSINRNYTIISAVIAFWLWGGWAYYLSYDKSIGIASGVVSGLTQGVASLTITLCMVKVVSWLFKRMPSSYFSVVLSAVFTVSVTGSCLYMAHFLVGTQDIILTIILPLSVAFVFCLITAYGLKGQHTVGGE